MATTDLSKFEHDFLRVTQSAAIASYSWIGKGDRHAADDAATKAMREKFNEIEFHGTVVIGEGERDEAPMLFIGEKLGNANGQAKGPKIDIAVDPLEGTNLAAENKPGAICVIAAAPSGRLFHAPDTYMEKIAVGPKIGNSVSLSKSVEENLDAIAKKTGKKMDKITVVVLDRPRHSEIISRIKTKGANVKLITDGDVFGGVSTAFDHTGVDMLLGIGAAPEGVLTAAALKCVGGYLEGRLKFRNEDEKKRAVRMGIKEKDFDKIYTMDELVKGNDMMFVATGVTDSDLLKGVKQEKGDKDSGSYVTESIVFSKKYDTPLLVRNKTFGKGQK
ncbi:class II fructose-bisphosphatase [Candidatus Micrarchaeota archaeon]|nr:class II fructose-bisphosphatase [Candidatus Micrarchaeota archaeon]